MTPPLAAVAKAIRIGMDPFKEMIADSFRKAFAKTTFRVVEDGHDKQFRQVRLRLEDLEFHYDRLMSSLKPLESQSASELEMGVAGLRDAFSRFVTEMHSSCRALEFYSGDVRACHQALDRLPYQYIVAIIERLLSGEQTAVMAISQIQLALDNVIRIWAISV